MLVRIQAAQQGQTANPANQRTIERPERPERPEQPERPEVGYEVRVQNGLPVVPVVPPVPIIKVNTGGPADMIPPQAVDISIAFFVMCAVMIIGWPLARAFGKRLERSGQAAAVSPAVTEQLGRIEQAVEAMAIEVERISEAQRYFAKLQSATLNEPAALESGDRR